MESKLSVKILMQRGNELAVKRVEDQIKKNEGQLKQLLNKHEKELQAKPDDVELKSKLEKEVETLKEKQEKDLKDLKEKVEKDNTSLIHLGQGTTQIYCLLKDIIEDVDLFILKVHPLLGEIYPLTISLLDKYLSGGNRRKPQIPKGTRDYLPNQMIIREYVFNTIRKIFKRHGAVEIDTPVFEHKSTLTGKYGEDSKLIYDLADQGGAELSLRYDLTVPFARFLSTNSIGNIKRYHIARVYRRDNPVLSKGRFREFYQCDYDIAGKYDIMIPEADVLSVACGILSSLPIGDFIFKLNHRKLLDSMMEICGVPKDKFRAISSAIDKLDKESWEDVSDEMHNTKGLPMESVNMIKKFVDNKGNPKELLSKFKNNKSEWFGENPIANEALNELEILYNYLEAMDVLKYIQFDMSLARGLDYYTGVIYEAILTDPSIGVGSISAGGRYDNLVGMFTPGDKETPCVGVSIGVERVFAIMERQSEKTNELVNKSKTSVFIASIGNNLVSERMKIANELWNNNISAEFLYSNNPNMKKQLAAALEKGHKYMIVVGEDEIKKNVVKVKVMDTKEEIEVARSDMVKTLLEKGCGKVEIESL